MLTMDGGERRRGERQFIVYEVKKTFGHASSYKIKSSCIACCCSIMQASWNRTNTQLERDPTKKKTNFEFSGLMNKQRRTEFIEAVKNGFSCFFSVSASFVFRFWLHSDIKMAKKRHNLPFGKFLSDKLKPFGVKQGKRMWKVPGRHFPSHRPGWKWKSCKVVSTDSSTDTSLFIVHFVSHFRQYVLGLNRRQHSDEKIIPSKPLFNVPDLFRRKRFHLKGRESGARRECLKKLTRAP